MLDGARLVVVAASTEIKHQPLTMRLIKDLIIFSYKFE